jgi:hypothetical protein
MKKEKKKRGWVFQKIKCPPFADKKNPVYKVTSKYTTKVHVGLYDMVEKFARKWQSENIKFLLCRGGVGGTIG